MDLAEVFHKGIEWRIDHGLDLIGGWIGQRRTFKSYAGLRFGEWLAENTEAGFGINKVTFYPRGLIRFLDKAESGRINIIFWDEPQLKASSRNFWKELNKQLKKVVEAMGPLQIVLMMATHRWGKIEKDIREAVNFTFEGLGKLHKVNGKTCSVFKPFINEMKPKSNEFFYKYPRVSWTKWDRAYFQKPDRELSRKYDDKRLGMTREIIQGAKENLGMTGEDEEEKEKTPMDYAEQLIENYDIEALTSKKTGKCSASRVQVLLPDIAVNQARAVNTAVNMKLRGTKIKKE